MSLAMIATGKHVTSRFTYNVPYGFHTVQIIETVPQLNGYDASINHWIETPEQAHKFFNNFRGLFSRTDASDMEYYFLLASDQNLIDNEITLVNEWGTFRIIDAMAFVNV